MEQLDHNLLFRWFVGLEMDEPVWNHARTTDRITLSEAPSPLHQIYCKELSNGAECEMSPLAPGKGEFRISFATDTQQPPHAVMVAKNVDLTKAEVVPAEGRGGIKWISGLFLAMLASGLVAMGRR